MWSRRAAWSPLWWWPCENGNNAYAVIINVNRDSYRQSYTSYGWPEIQKRLIIDLVPGTMWVVLVAGCCAHYFRRAAKLQRENRKHYFLLDSFSIIIEGRGEAAVSDIVESIKNDCNVKAEYSGETLHRLRLMLSSLYAASASFYLGNIICFVIYEQVAFDILNVANGNGVIC